MNKVILTGGPHSGKTTLLDGLRRRGVRVQSEAALDEIKILVAAMGVSAQRTWRLANMSEFQVRVARRQEAAERALDQAKDALVAVLDRGSIDGIAYCQFHGIVPPQELVDIAARARYSLVISCDLVLPFDVRTQSGRISDEMTASTVRDLIDAAYLSYGVPVERLAVLERQAREVAALELISRYHRGLDRDR